VRWYSCAYCNTQVAGCQVLARNKIIQSPISPLDNVEGGMVESTWCSSIITILFSLGDQVDSTTDPVRCQVPIKKPSPGTSGAGR
jgi:hypothetical protein